MKFKTRTFTAAFLVTFSAFLCADSAASVVIDPFDEVDASVTWPIAMDTVGTAPAVVETGLSTVLGGQRTTRLTAEALDIERLDEVQVGVFAVPGILAYASSILGDGKLELVYDGGSAGLSVDLSGDAWIEIELLAFDWANGADMDVSITLSDGTTDAVLMRSVSTFGLRDIIFPFVKFSDFASLDLSDIDTITVNFDPGFGADFRVGEISSVVPEPATLGLLLSGALFGLRRRRR